MKEVVITKVEGGFIVRASDLAIQNQKISVTPNLGRAVKIAKVLFGEDEPEVQESSDKPQPEQAVKGPIFAAVEAAVAKGKKA